MEDCVCVHPCSHHSPSLCFQWLMTFIHRGYRICPLILQTWMHISDSYPMYFHTRMKPDSHLRISPSVCFFPAFTFTIPIWPVPLHMGEVNHIWVTGSMSRDYLNCRRHLRPALNPHVSEVGLMGNYQQRTMPGFLVAQTVTFFHHGFNPNSTIPFFS